MGSQSTEAHRNLPDIAEVNTDGHNAEDQNYDEASLLTRSFKIQLTGKMQFF